jgi:hypothetical protein
VTGIALVIADPTISFQGLQTWRRNIASLAVFFREPQLDLFDIQLDQ